MPSANGPVCLVDLELAAPAPELPARTPDGQRYVRAAVAVRVHHELIGVVDLPVEGDRPDIAELSRLATAALQERVNAHLHRDGLGPGVYRNGGPPSCLREHALFLETAPPASVVIATRDGEATLAATLDSLLALDYPDFEVVEVDNASRGDGPRAVVDAYRDAARAIRYVREDRPGLAVAHNRGLAHASGEIVAFLDDDVVADPRWLAQIAKAFASEPGVACVTGLILAAELESPAQLWIEGYWGFNKGFERRVFDARRPAGPPLYPFTPGGFRSGAQMALPAAAPRAPPGGDPAPGPR